jgi:hypothetical protein
VELDAVYCTIYRAVEKKRGTSGNFKGSGEGKPPIPLAWRCCQAKEEDRRPCSDSNYRVSSLSLTAPSSASSPTQAILASDVPGNLLVVDDTKRLQVFRPKGEHLCTRSDLGLHDR